MPLLSQVVNPYKGKQSRLDRERGVNVVPLTRCRGGAKRNHRNKPKKNTFMVDVSLITRLAFTSQVLTSVLPLQTRWSWALFFHLREFRGLRREETNDTHVLFAGGLHHHGFF